MPTDMLRKRSRPPQGGGAAGAVSKRRLILIRFGGVEIVGELAASATADRLWAALPLHSTVETWGACLHCELPVESGRDRSARRNGQAGEIYFWAEEGRLLIPFGPTAISRYGEMRLPAPCNVIATTQSDLSPLNGVRAGAVARLTAHGGAEGPPTARGR